MSPLTAEELGRLRVPLAALPGLYDNPMGLLVVDADDEWGVIVCRAQDYDDPAPGDNDHETPLVLVAWSRCGADAEAPEWIEVADLSVSLDVGPNADRVARWLAARVGLEVGCTAPLWSVCARGWGGHGWALTQRDFEGETTCKVFASPYNGGDCAALTEMDELRTDAGPRLPDGSLFRDRLALALVAQHIGGAR